MECNFNSIIMVASAMGYRIFYCYADKHLEMLHNEAIKITLFSIIIFMCR